VVELVDVPLPGERDQVATKELPDFAHMRAHVYRLIKGERPTRGSAGASPERTAPQPAAGGR
jgi:NitT/TauT family transport system ATP-binding protein